MEMLVNVLMCIAIALVIVGALVSTATMIASERRWARYEKTREEIFAKMLRESEGLEDAAVEADEG